MSRRMTYEEGYAKALIDVRDRGMQLCNKRQIPEMLDDMLDETDSEPAGIEPLDTSDL